MRGQPWDHDRVPWSAVFELWWNQRGGGGGSNVFLTIFDWTSGGQLKLEGLRGTRGGVNPPPPPTNRTQIVWFTISSDLNPSSRVESCLSPGPTSSSTSIDNDCVKLVNEYLYKCSSTFSHDTNYCFYALLAHGVQFKELQNSNVKKYMLYIHI